LDIPQSGHPQPIGQGQRVQRHQEATTPSNTPVLNGVTKPHAMKTIVRVHPHVAIE
jgi:hypothetical protein